MLVRFFVVLLMLSTLGWAEEPDRKEEYVRAVTGGAEWLPWQSREVSPEEKQFREGVESRKSELLSKRTRVPHPVLFSQEDLGRAQQNIEREAWAKKWFDGVRSSAESLAAHPAGWVEDMLPELSPAHGYGSTCPKCVGQKSQEAAGYSQLQWDHSDPEVLVCSSCGQRYPDPAFPETAVLHLPRSGQAISYYLNDAERAQPDDRSGALAWHWVGHPVHMSFSGLIRERKVQYMCGAARTLGVAHALTGDLRYAERAKAILLRFARCYRHWCYRDYWDTYADCDPLYAAWHDTSLPLEWKRHLSGQAYQKDTLEKAAMEQTYWGAGRVHPSTDNVGVLPDLLLAYDLTYSARLADGTPLWTEEERAIVERDGFLEYIMGAEPYVGGENHADNENNKSPRIYNAMAALGKCLGLPGYADTALRGYEKVRDDSFLDDGFSKESPAYTNMYLNQLLLVPETLHGFVWPEGFAGRSGAVDLYASDGKLRRMYETVLQMLCPDGSYLPLSDTQVGGRPDTDIILMGLRHYPDIFGGTVPTLVGQARGEYAVFRSTPETLAEEQSLPQRENLFPDWQTATLRHGSGTKAAVAALAFNPPGGHRHWDNLALFYQAGGINVLGEQGYLCDMPLNDWIRNTQSHNLVVVDDKNQEMSGRSPEFGIMAASPLATVVEASSHAYPQCSEYRRRVVMIKGPEGNTVLVDLFRVAGGGKHAYRVFSDIASSTGSNGRIEFDGVNLPVEAPLPQLGGSLADADIFGLRDIRSANPEQPVWSATWREDGGAYRLWMISHCDRVEAANGPGQRTLTEPGRRVRYVNAVREGKPESVFVAVHEPGLADGTWAVHSAKQLVLPESAGPRAVGLELETRWGRYIVLNDVAADTTIEGIHFNGRFGVFRFSDGTPKGGFACDAQVENQGIAWQGKVQTQTASAFTPETERPTGWTLIPDAVQAFATVKSAEGWTGFPVASAGEKTIDIAHYPLPAITEFRLPAIWYAPASTP